VPVLSMDRLKLKYDSDNAHENKYVGQS